MTEDNPGYDLTGLIVGNEGTFGIVTKVVVNLTRDPEAGRTLLAVFEQSTRRQRRSAGLSRAGIVPAALEMLDNLMIRAVEQAFGFGFPVEAGAVLIIEVDGLEAGMDREARRSADRARTWGLGRQVDHLADAQGAGIRGDLEEPEVGLRGDWPAKPDLLHAGRCRATHQAAGDLAVYRRGRKAA